MIHLILNSGWTNRLVAVGRSSMETTGDVNPSSKRYIGTPSHRVRKLQYILFSCQSLTKSSFFCLMLRSTHRNNASQHGRSSTRRRRRLNIGRVPMVNPLLSCATVRPRFGMSIPRGEGRIALDNFIKSHPRRTQFVASSSSSLLVSSRPCFFVFRGKKYSREREGREG